MTIFIRIITHGLENIFSQDYMNSEEYNGIILPEIITPKIRINDQYIDESTINRSIPELLYPSQIGRIISGPIGYIQTLRVKTGGI